MHVDSATSLPVSRDDDECLGDCEQLLGHRFRDRHYLELALTHTSLAYEAEGGGDPQADNERLEFLGDAVVGLAVTDFLFRTYSGLSEGQMTRIRAQLVSRRHLGRTADRLQIGRFLRLGKSEERSGGRRKPAILANAMEAVIAAVYLDAGFGVASRLVQQWLVDGGIEAIADAVRDGRDPGDPKSTLQEYLHTSGQGQPGYRVISETGPDHSKNFVVEVSIRLPDGARRALATAAGLRKKEAEQEAARIALESLRSGRLRFDSSMENA